MDESLAYPIDGPLIAEVFRLGLGAEPEQLPRHRHQLTRAEVELQQRARIILATAELVTTRTYAKTTTREIIVRAGVSSKTFYAFYSGKEEAFLAGYTLLDGVMLELTRQPIRSAQPRTALRAAVTASLERLAAWPLLTRMRLVEGRAAGPIAEQRRGELNDAMVAAFASAIAHARGHDPRIGEPSLGAVAVLVSGLSELSTQHVIRASPSTLPGLAPVMVEAIERFCLGDVPQYRLGE